MPSILDDIIEHTRAHVELTKTKRSVSELIEGMESVPDRADFLKAIEDCPTVALIAEVKKASPSKGLIREDFHPVEIAKAYAASGATCLSVLTDEKYFQGHLDYLQRIRDAVSQPLLRKDFIIDPYQVYEAKARGASAVLLIAECLDPGNLKELHDLIVSLKMTPLVEFHDEANLEKTLDCGARLIGVNNRDLKTFQTDLNHVIRLRERIPEDRLVVAESGIETHEDMLRLKEAGIQAMLVGESLMRQTNIHSAVRNLLQGKAGDSMK